MTSDTTANGQVRDSPECRGSSLRKLTWAYLALPPRFRVAAHCLFRSAKPREKYQEPLEVPTACYFEGLPGDVVGVIAHKKPHGSTHVVDRSKPASWNLG
jgi:hypothetical protein